jgi:DNA mismatch repair protein MutS
MSLYDEYCDVFAKYRPLYGERTLVMFEVGSFLEWYNCDRGLGADVKGVCELLNVQATRRNKSIVQVSRQNPEMGGIPRNALPKYLPVLIEADYTVVLVTQTTPPPNPRREVTDVFSRSTCLEALGGGMGSGASRPMMCIVAELDQGQNRNPSPSPSPSPSSGPILLGFGVSTLDAITGESTAYECWAAQHEGDAMSVVSPSSPSPYTTATWDELRRCVTNIGPSEIMVVVAPPCASCTVIEFLIQCGGGVFGQHHRRSLASSASSSSSMMSGVGALHDWSTTRPDYCNILSKPLYQNEILRRAFSETGMLTPAEHCGLERQPLALASFVGVVDFAHQHNESIVARIAPPAVRDARGRLTMAHGSLAQLDIISADRPRDCLLGLLNRAATPQGRRLFSRLLLDPISDPDELSSRYDATCMLLKDRAFEHVRKVLGRCYDAPRLCRRLSIGRLQPRELGMLWDTLTASIDLCDVIPPMFFALRSSSLLLTRLPVAATWDGLRAALISARTFLDDNFVVDEVPKYAAPQDATTNIMRPGVAPEVDRLFDALLAARNVVATVAERLNEVHAGAASSSTPMFKVDDMGGDAGIVTTVKRFTLARDSASKWPPSAQVLTGPWSTVLLPYLPEARTCWVVNHAELVGTTAVGFGAGYVRLQHPVLTTATACMQTVRRGLNSELPAEYHRCLAAFSAQHASALDAMMRLTEWVDFFTTCALNAHEFRHTRPTLISPQPAASAGGGQLAAYGLRHPIIEVINDRVPHVSNDVVLGQDDQRSMLLYGINAAGKSSLMKAIGLAVVMAQAGMFVAAYDMRIAPYNTIMTRIQSNDNIYAGQSTFMAEMQELRTIIRRADARSLVLGDEVCAGTESISATAIVGATLVRLTEAKASFVFATHLHELGDIELPEGRLEGMHTWHLSVRTDPSTGALVYDRRLASGRGSNLYGLEVCQALGMDSEFMQTASSIRQQLLGNPAHGIIDTDRPRSRYCAKVLVDTCTICKKARAAEVHHIKHQAWADTDGYIGNEHKNRMSNLVTLCEDCHDKVHNGSLCIDGYAQTTKGVQLQVHHLQSRQDSKADTADATSSSSSSSLSSTVSTSSKQTPSTSSMISQDLQQAVLTMRAYGFSYKKIANTLALRHDNIQLSPHIVRRIWMAAATTKVAQASLASSQLVVHHPSPFHERPSPLPVPVPSLPSPSPSPSPSPFATYALHHADSLLVGSIDVKKTHPNVDDRS